MHLAWSVLGMFEPRPHTPQRAARLDQIGAELVRIHLDPHDDRQQQQSKERDRLTAPKQIKERKHLALEERLDNDAERNRSKHRPRRIRVGGGVRKQQEGERQCFTTFLETL